MQAAEEYHRFDKLIRKYYCDQQMIRELLRILIRDLPKSLRELEEGLMEADVRKIRKAAHSLANISGTVLESEILELSRKIEYACASQNLKDVESYLPPLRQRISELCVDAGKYLQVS
ncbi:MAG: Hpt domain-containing protein [Spirochaetes bacterium]|nr:Hpt domain-containing protein [Spirochaetota bacterium]